MAGPVGFHPPADQDAEGRHRRPDDAVQHGANGLYAYSVSADNKAELRWIKVTNSIDGRSVVDEGLSPGQQVITAGQYKVQPGALVATAVASSDAGSPKARQQ